jgi:two-component system LytT family response regulator
MTDLNDITYCKADCNYTLIYLKDNSSIIVTKVLKCVESILPKDISLRIHRSYLININHVTGIKHKNMLILKLNIELPIA